MNGLRRLLGIAALSAAACSSAPKPELDAWQIQERVASQITLGMSRSEVFGILGYPSTRKLRAPGDVEWQSRADEQVDRGQHADSECSYWGSDAVVCFGKDGGVISKRATGGTVSR